MPTKGQRTSYEADNRFQTGWGMALAGEAAQQPLTGTGAVLTLAVALRSVRRFEQRNPHQAFLGRPMNVGPLGRWPTSYLPSFR